jgi:flagellar motor switch protein FliM
MFRQGRPCPAEVLENKLSTPNQNQMPSGQPQPGKTDAAPRSVHSCNFRSAGRLSNEDARSLSAIHDVFARQLASALDAQLATDLEVKLKTLDQLALKDHMEGITSYIVPLSLGTLAGHVVVECDLRLVLLMLELLMGGTGEVREEECELSEIDEEIMHDVIQLIADQAEQAWRIPGLSLTVNPPIKPEAFHRFCPANEKVAVLKFGVHLAGASGSFNLVFPAGFLSVLIKQIKLDQPQKKRLWTFPTPPFRERILDCDIDVSAELPGLKVAVRDLIALQPGSVLKLRAPIQTPGVLTAGARAIFEAVPVRNGAQRAAQLGRRTNQADWKSEESKNG